MSSRNLKHTSRMLEAYLEDAQRYTKKVVTPMNIGIDQQNEKSGSVSIDST